MPIKVFDFFSGCGGTSKGFSDAGMDIVWALDNDRYAANTFRMNFPMTYFAETDIDELELNALQPFNNLCEANPILFTGCAPCQPYSPHNKKNDPDDERRTLLEKFGRFIVRYKPHYVFVENVPGLQETIPDKDSPFGLFLDMLDRNGYQKAQEVIFSQDYGVPQHRKRLVLIASRLGPIKIPPKTHGPNTDNPAYSTVRDWIEHFPSIEAGETHSTIPNHQAPSLSALNLQRLLNTPPEGNRRNWPEELVLECHREYDGHTDVYGRMRWDRPSTCLTTRCTSISNGRFAHPVQNRAISGREAASLQTFPENFVFDGGTYSVARQIGNAVPVLLAKRFGEHFIKHYGSHSAAMRI